MSKQIRKTFRFDEKTDRMLQRNILASDKEKKLSESEYIRRLVRQNFTADVQIAWKMLRQVKGIKINTGQVIRKLKLSDDEKLLKEVLLLEEEILHFINDV